MSAAEPLPAPPPVDPADYRTTTFYCQSCGAEQVVDDRRPALRTCRCGSGWFATWPKGRSRDDVEFGFEVRPLGFLRVI
ncbi:MAG: hypothetical protein ABR532_02335 [Candidatus Dormibacteria bacterium]